MEENKDMEQWNDVKDKKTKGPLIIIIVLLIIVIAGILIYLNKDSIFKKEEPKETTKEVEKTEKEDKDELTKEEIEARLTKYVTIGATQNYGADTYNYFVNGAKEITNNEKYIMTNISIYKDDKVTKNTKLTEEEINNLEGTKPDDNEKIDIVKVEDFNDAYKELFNEEASYKIEDLKMSGCPSPWAMDKAKTKLIYFHRCGGTSEIKYENSVKSIDSDDDYYYVHQELTETNPKGEVNKISLLWIFDKDLNFVSTEKE